VGNLTLLSFSQQNYTATKKMKKERQFGKSHIILLIIELHCNKKKKEKRMTMWEIPHCRPLHHKATLQTIAEQQRVAVLLLVVLLFLQN
jgi:hypothetical protein